MNAEFFVAIEELEKEKGIPRQYMYDKIHQAMMAAFRKDNPNAADNVVIDMNEEKRKIEMYVEMEVVDVVQQSLFPSAPRSAAPLRFPLRPRSLAVSQLRLQSRLSFRASARPSAASFMSSSPARSMKSSPVLFPASTPETAPFPSKSAPTASIPKQLCPPTSRLRAKN